MEPGQYTGKTDATPGERPHSEAVPSPAPAPASQQGTSVRATRVRPPSTRSGGDMMRVVTWGAVLVILLAGLALYFRYERAIVPLFGRGR